MVEKHPTFALIFLILPASLILNFILDSFMNKHWFKRGGGIFFIVAIFLNSGLFFVLLNLFNESLFFLPVFVMAGLGLEYILGDLKDKKQVRITKEHKRRLKVLKAKTTVYGCIKEVDEEGLEERGYNLKGMYGERGEGI